MSDNTNRPGAVNTTPLPPPDTHCFDEDTNMDVWSYSAPLVDLIVKQARADLEAENKRLREALEAILDEQNDNEGYAKPATYDAARAALKDTK